MKLFVIILVGFIQNFLFVQESPDYKHNKNAKPKNFAKFPNNRIVERTNFTLDTIDSKKGLPSDKKRRQLVESNSTESSDYLHKR